MDNIFVERLWRSVKYEKVYLKAYPNIPETKAGIGAYLRFYSEERPHQSLCHLTIGIYGVILMVVQVGGCHDNRCSGLCRYRRWIL